MWAFFDVVFSYRPLFRQSALLELHSENRQNTGNILSYTHSSLSSMTCQSKTCADNVWMDLLLCSSHMSLTMATDRAWCPAVQLTSSFRR